MVISSLLIYQLTITAKVAILLLPWISLYKPMTFCPLRECTFPADKGYDAKKIYSQISENTGQERMRVRNNNSIANLIRLPILVYW